MQQFFLKFQTENVGRGPTTVAAGESCWFGETFSEIVKVQALTQCGQVTWDNSQALQSPWHRGC
jgi:hypothetical protein